MPTALTAHIEDGNISTGADFLKLCTRAFFVGLKFKDDDRGIPDFDNLDTDSESVRHAELDLAEAKARLDYWLNINESDAKAIMKKHNTDAVSRHEQMRSRAALHVERYNKVRAEVAKWKAPSLKHAELKKFALEQIDKCLDWEMKTAESKIDDEDIFSDVSEFISYQIKTAGRDIRSYAEDVGIARANAKKGCEWVKVFLESLKSIEEGNGHENNQS